MAPYLLWEFIIYSALLKYGYAAFRLEILEYCDDKILLQREQYYIDKLKPKYNILKIAGSSLGFKHSIKTRKQMSIKNTKDKHPFFAFGSSLGKGPKG